MIDLRAKSAAALFAALALSLFAGCSEPARSSTPVQGPAAKVEGNSVVKAAPASDPAPKAESGPATEKAADSSTQAPTGNAAATAASNLRGTPAAPVKLRPDARGITDITFDTIKFDMEKTAPFVRKMLTPTIEGLAEKRVRIRGYILPPFQQTGLTQFVLVRDNLECCFGPGAALYDCILVEMLPGKNTDYDVRPVAVEGVFKIEEFKGPDGKHLAIYRLDGESVIH